MARPLFDASKLNGTTGNLGSIVGKAHIGTPKKGKRKINKKARKKGALKR
jgi:hypothetical protein